MTQIVAGLSTRESRAALLVAEDTLTNEQIAAEVGVQRRTLDRWKLRPAFAARVREHKEAFKDAALTSGFADKRARVQLLNALIGDFAAMAQKQGYVREEVKLAANGEHVSYEVFDQPLVSQLRGALDDIAREMGDRATKTELTGKDGGPLVLLAGVDTGRV